MTNIEKIEKLFDLSSVRSMEITPCVFPSDGINEVTHYKVKDKYLCMHKDSEVSIVDESWTSLEEITFKEPIDILQAPKALLDYCQIKIQVPKDIIVIGITTCNTWSNETLYTSGDIMPLSDLLMEHAKILLPGETFLYTEMVRGNFYQTDLKQLKNIDGIASFSIAPQQKQEQKEFYNRVRHHMYKEAKRLGLQIYLIKYRGQQLIENKKEN